MDQDLHDDMVKLVRYNILFVKRDYEVAFGAREDVVADNMDAATFTAWKVAEFIQSLARGETEVPRVWRDRNYPPADCLSDGKKLNKLPEWDQEYLRVSYEVLDRYPREKFKYDEKEISLIEQIRAKLA